MNSTVSIYSFVSFCHNDLLPIIEKSVTVSTNGNIIFGVLGKKIEAEQLNITPAKSLEDFANNLKQFEKVYVCHGGPLVNQFSKLTNTKSVANSVGRLQHINCCLVMKEKATCCVKCRRLVNVLTMRKKRKNAGAQEHLLLSPSKRKLFNKIQNEKKCLKKKVVRAKEKINELNSELNKVKKNMATICDEKIEEQLNNMSGINESQKTLIKECFAASKIKNTKSRRYSENWLMLCLLFNIRSPGAYKYLRDSQLLPLPHPKTVRQLLSSLKSTCGFDEDFLSLLAKKVQHMSSMEKHGVLLFDEISLRKSIQVSSSNLSYIGLEDHGNESTCHKEFADHALVFMWQSLGSNFSQTIGVFASKGDVKGKLVKKITII